MEERLKTMETMREFALLCNDKRLEALLSLVEERLPDKIGATPGEVKPVSLKRDEQSGCYTFFYHKQSFSDMIENDIEQLKTIIFHELMHICLRMDRWPKYLINAYNSEYYLKDAADILINMLEHTEIWRREKIYGFLGPTIRTWKIRIEQELPDILRCEAWTKGWNDPWRAPYQVLFLAQIWLSPTTKSTKARLYRILRKHLTQQTYQQVKTIAQTIRDKQSLFPQDRLETLYAVRKIAKLPEGLILPESGTTQGTSLPFERIDHLFSSNQS